MRIRNVALAAIACLAFTSSTIEAQDTPRARQFGVLVGYSMATINDLGLTQFELEGIDIHSKRRVGNQLGAYVMFPVTNRFAFQPELHYVQKGVKFEFGGGIVDGESVPSGSELTFKLAYMEVPLLARFELAGPDSHTRPFIVVGPSIALRAACQYGLAGDGVEFDIDCEESSSLGEAQAPDPFRKYDYGLVGGAGVQGRFMGLPISLQARYGRGFAVISRDDDTAPTSTKPKNSNISILFGIGF